MCRFAASAYIIALSIPKLLLYFCCVCVYLNKIQNLHVLFQELEKSDCVALRNNRVVMMADFAFSILLSLIGKACKQLMSTVI